MNFRFPQRIFNSGAIFNQFDSSFRKILFIKLRLYFPLHVNLFFKICTAGVFRIPLKLTTQFYRKSRINLVYVSIIINVPFPNKQFTLFPTAPRFNFIAIIKESSDWLFWFSFPLKKLNTCVNISVRMRNEAKGISYLSAVSCLRVCQRKFIIREDKENSVLPT